MQTFETEVSERYTETYKIEFMDGTYLSPISYF